MLLISRNRLLENDRLLEFCSKSISCSAHSFLTLHLTYPCTDCLQRRISDLWKVRKQMTISFVSLQHQPKISCNRKVFLFSILPVQKNHPEFCQFPQKSGENAFSEFSSPEQTLFGSMKNGATLHLLSGIHFRRFILIVPNRSVFELSSNVIEIIFSSSMPKRESLYAIVSLRDCCLAEHLWGLLWKGVGTKTIQRFAFSGASLFVTIRYHKLSTFSSGNPV